MNRRLIAGVFFASLGLSVAAGCSDDDTDDMMSETGGSDATGGMSETGGSDATGGMSETGGSDATGGTMEPTIPELPEALSLSGCESTTRGAPAVGPGPLCTVTQNDDSVELNCGGVAYSGTIDEDGDLTFGTTEPALSEDEANGEIRCEGAFAPLGNRLVNVECTRTVELAAGGSGDEQTCELTNAPVRPGFGCIELPDLSDVVVCVEGEDGDGDTETLGACTVTQSGCDFQAQCEGQVTLTGSIRDNAISFSRALTALADATTPTDGDGMPSGEPAFLKGAKVNHSCSAELDGSTLSGTCGAGGVGRGGTPTSVCAVSGEGGDVATCDLVAPTAEQVFVIDSCDILKNGEGGAPGIGEPVCAFRQNNCVWELQCGRTLKFGGLLEPGSEEVSWRLPTGTPCGIEFDDEGNVTGECTVAGQDACELKSMDAVPAVDGECDAVIVPDNRFLTRGCGDATGDRLDCRVYQQHKCKFAAICGFSFLTSNAIIGEVGLDGEQGTLDFRGLNGFECSVQEPTADDVANDNRADNEWYGQCTNPLTGGQCRDNYDAATGEGFRGLQFFVSPAE